MGLYDLFKMDENIEKTGIVLEYGFDKNSKPIRIRVARAGGSNTRFDKLLEQRLKPYRRQIQTDTMDRALLEDIMMNVFAETVILGWENVDDKDGNVIPFSKENCIKLFKDLPDLYRDIQEQSTKVALYRAEIKDIESGN